MVYGQSFVRLALMFRCRSSCLCHPKSGVFRKTIYLLFLKIFLASFKTVLELDTEARHSNIVLGLVCGRGEVMWDMRSAGVGGH